MKNCFIKILFVVLNFIALSAQDNDSLIISEMFSNALNSTEAYENLRLLTEEASPRQTGSENSVKSANMMLEMLKKLSPDNFSKQKYHTDIWYPSSEVELNIITENEKFYLNALAMGPSISTSTTGISSHIIELSDIGALENLSKEEVQGKILFFNKVMNNGFINPIDAYVDAFRTRVYGPSKAAEYGAIGVILRSASFDLNDNIHTGKLEYDESQNKIPVVVISANESEKLSSLLTKNPGTQAEMVVSTELLENIPSLNVIAELKGKSKPEEVIIIGAHIDTWYNTPGAHDDGAGCVQMIDVLRIFKELNIRNERTIRVVLFMDEELFKSGAKAYAESINSENEKIILGIESDLGGFSPEGFFIDSSDPELKRIQEIGKKLLPFGIDKFEKGFGGGDMIVLKRKFGFPSLALMVKSNMYFEILHTSNDTFDKVNRRELQMGSASIASLVYLIDKYGL